MAVNGFKYMTGLFIVSLISSTSVLTYGSGHDTSSARHPPWKVFTNFAKGRHHRSVDRNGIGLTFDPHVDDYNSFNDFGTTRQSHENHKPIFTNCSKYQPSVKEEEPKGTFVFQVHAEDHDPSDNGGNVTYKFVSAPGEKLKFNIVSDSGRITTRTIFDRDEPSREKEIYLTVRATDNGRPPLDDVCTIKVIIDDINDNQPVFDKVKYEESVPQDLLPGREVMRISATDIDDGDNSIVLYNLVPGPSSSNDSSYFRIDNTTGVITLDRPIDRSPGKYFRLKASATDQGSLPNPSFIDLNIQVVESNKKAPTFTSIHPPSPIVLLENLTLFDYNIATLTALSNTDEEYPVFELVTGRTEQTNKLSTFRLESESNTAQIRLARLMDYESIAEYTLTVRIQNKFKLAAETSINIQLKDVNDNIPAFTEVVSGSVLENEPPGTPVMQVKAIDHDSTTAHNQVTYELADNQDSFAIDRYTGNITTLKTFDREQQDFYSIKVIATDNSPSALYTTGEHNKGQQVFRIEIADKNDHPPKFTKFFYVAEAIPEDANINALVTEVKALDNDTASFVTYEIIKGNENDAFLIEYKTGKIRVKNQLDYETRTSYTLKVRAFDGVYDDYCTVEIKIENVNDNPPVFIDYQPNITIKEEELVPDCIVKLEAYDPDIPDRNSPQNIVYFVVKEEQKKLLTIDKNGCLSLIKPLNRDPPDGFEIWQVLIAASDEDGQVSSLRQSTEVVITLIDENDNAPFLDMAQPVVWPENQGAGKIVTLIAKDNDGPDNGPPFTFSLAANANEDIKTKFSIEDNDLKALVSFDREEKKSYMVPIAISDNGRPRQTGTSTLHVVIGDKNDNPMKKGSSKIFIYNYKGEAPDTEIGRVYVEDPDDWDLPDKHFIWADHPHANFDLDSKTGMIIMLQGTTNQSFILNFNVTEQAYPLIPKHTVTAVVNVTVKDIPEEAVDKSGSIRFGGITAEEFVQIAKNGKSKQSILREKLANYLNVSVDNVDVFTVLHSPHNPNTSQLDVRFSAHGSPYYQPEKLNAIVSLHKLELETALDVKILMINIDECLIEKMYCNGSCTNFLKKSNIPSAVYTNTTSFVGVGAVVDPLCTCELTERVVCYNGGTLVGNECECPEGYEGPFCEILAIGFYGDGFGVYPRWKSCTESHLSLELIAHKPNGLVFYIGPTAPNDAFSIQDFMSLELREGFPVLLVDYGSGTVRIDHKQIMLSDGKKHRIDVIWSKTSIELQVDKCKLPTCLSLTLPAGPFEYLNPNGPLQIGGSFHDMETLSRSMNWTHVPFVHGFSGCVKNFTFNGKLYNLGMPEFSKNIDVGCSTGLAMAVSLGIDTSFIIAILICTIILLILLLAVVVHRRKADDLYKDTDDIRENIINYADESGENDCEGAYDLNVLRLIYNEPIQDKHQPDHLVQHAASDEAPDICSFLDGKKQSVDNDPESNPFDDVRHYAYEGDGNTTGSLSSLASGTDDGDLNFDYLSNFGPRFRKLADMYGEDPSDDDEDNYHHMSSESWC